MELKVKTQIKELLKEHNISLRELSRRTSIGHASLSNLSNQKLSSIFILHLKSIAEELNIRDMNKIISFEFVDEENVE